MRTPDHTHAAERPASRHLERPLPSIREVCLIGGDAPPAGDLPVGEHVQWAGRAYRVLDRQRPLAGSGVGYVHLAAADGAEPTRRSTGRELVAPRSA